MGVIVLTNSFHRTSAGVRPILITEGRFRGYYRISRRVAMRLRSTLCGADDCTCGGNFGERGGPWLYLYNEDADRNYIIDLAASNL